MKRMIIKRFKFVTTVLAALVVTIGAEAQTDPLLTQQWLSRINVNPAATGNSEYIDIYVLARRQWWGFDGAPGTEVLNAHAYFDRIQSGVGLTATHDNLGVGMDAINAKLAYAYHANLGSNWLLSLGLSGGIIQQNFNASKYLLQNPDDVSLIESASKLNPDVDFGIELTSPRLRFGASVTHLLNLEYLDILKDSQITQQYHAYLSYRQPVGSSFDLIVSARAMNFDNSPFVELGLMGTYQKNYWLGVAYRAQNISDPLKPASLAAMLGVQVSFVRIGYSYDYSLGEVGNLGQNSHEIMLSFRIAKPKKQIRTKSPRFIETY